MEKQIYNEKNGLWYELQGDYYLSCLTLPKQEDVEIGVWGQRTNNIRNRAMEIVNAELIYA